MPRHRKISGGRGNHGNNPTSTGPKARPTKDSDAAPKRKRRSNNPEGRPSTGLTEVVFLVRGPKGLLDSMVARADSLHVSIAEAWRRAAVSWLQEESEKRDGE